MLLASVTFAQDRGAKFHERELAGITHLEAEEWAKAIAAFEEQITLNAENSRPYYNIACADALQGNTISALIRLGESVAKGFHDVAHLDRDTDLDSLRRVPAFQKIRQKAEANYSRFSAIGPQVIPTANVRPAESVAVILAEGYLANLALSVDEQLQEESRIRGVLFGHYDIQMARFARYIRENGRARDAHEAGRERVRLASLYLLRSNDGEALKVSATALVMKTAEEFLGRWPGSAHRAEVQFWLAHAMPDATAIPLLRNLVVDAAGTPSGARAAVELALRDPTTRAEVYREFIRQYVRTELGIQLLHSRLWRVRLEVEGIPDLQFEPALGDLRRGTVIIAVVMAGQKASVEGVKQRAGSRIGLVVVRGTWPDDGIAKAKDPLRAVLALAAPTAPVFLTFKDGKLSRN
jgi:tetratricopeptide (TPR) repeat protein